MPGSINKYIQSEKTNVLVEVSSSLFCLVNNHKAVNSTDYTQATSKQDKRSGSTRASWDRE